MRSMAKGLGLVTWGILALSIQADAQADVYHYENLRHGQTAMGRGGAVTALSGEPETSFYNPAGLAEVKGTVLAGSIQFFGKDTRTLKQGFGRGEWFAPRDQVGNGE